MAAAIERLLLGLTADIADARLAQIAGMAHDLGAELEALLIGDARAGGLADWPQARAFDAAAATWRALSREAVADADAAIAAIVERELRRHAAAIGIPVQFGLSAAADWRARVAQPQARLVVVPEPANAIERWLSPFVDVVDAALASRAPLLFLPSPRRGEQSRAPRLLRELTVALAQPAVAVRGGFETMLARAVDSASPLITIGHGDLPDPPRPALFAAADLGLALLLQGAGDAR